jgi:hypothetical protein
MKNNKSLPLGGKVDMKIKKLILKTLLEILEDCYFDPREDGVSDLYINLRNTIRNKLDMYE